jgi:FAD/FMN-containing dehydrogenase
MTAAADTTATVDELRGSFAGELIQPGDLTYDEHCRVWNGSIDRSPALIARCRGVADVIAAIRFARDIGLPAAVRGGGHSYPGHSVCDGGIVIDLGPMTGVRVDPQRRTARVQAGVLWGELDRETQAFGLATTGGFVSHTGVAGLTLGGGIGWLHRKHGLTIDQLLSVDLVTAEGEPVKASETENPELFWGLGGGGGNFGIITEFEFRLHPIRPAVLAGPIYWPMEKAPALPRFYREWIAEAPDELMTIVMQRRAPAVDFLPAELHGELIVAVTCCYAAAIEDGEEVLRRLRDRTSLVRRSRASTSPRHCRQAKTPRATRLLASRSGWAYAGRRSHRAWRDAAILDRAVLAVARGSARTGRGVAHRGGRAAA